MKPDWSTGGGLAAIVLWSTTVAVARSLSERMGPLTAGACVYLIGGLLCLLRLACQPTPIRQFLLLSRRYVFGCGFLFVLYTVLAYAFWDRAMRKGRLTLVVACSYFTPLLSTLMSCLYLGVKPGMRLWAGCLLLVIGSFMTWLSLSDRPSKSRG